MRRCLFSFNYHFHPNLKVSCDNISCKIYLCSQSTQRLAWGVFFRSFQLSLRAEFKTLITYQGQQLLISTCCEHFFRTFAVIFYSYDDIFFYQWFLAHWRLSMISLHLFFESGICWRNRRRLVWWDERTYAFCDLAHFWFATKFHSYLPLYVVLWLFLKAHPLLGLFH